MDKLKTFALAGNPNCGKTTLFNSLTGSTAYVGNWPGVTVERRGGTYKKKNGKLEASIIDLPGIYSLSPYTPEEVVARNFIIDGNPDCVINVIDATNLERNLYMTTQILEMDVPVVIALNMMDSLYKDKEDIDAEALSKALGVPVVKISALKFQGLDDLMEKAYLASLTPRKGESVLEAGNSKEMIEQAFKLYDAKHITHPLFHAIKALENDEIETTKNKEAAEEVKKLNSASSVDFEAASADERYKYITSHYSIYKKGKPTENKKTLSTSDKIDKILTNKWAGIPLFLVILFIVFHITFADDLFYMNAMGLDVGTFAEGTMWEGLFYDGGIASIGTFFANLMNCLTGGLNNWLVGLISKAAGENSWAVGFIGDGVLNGLAAVLGFLPQVLLLFFFFSILEDSGYMARVAFILDRIFRRFGLSGRAFLPMIMGLGCGVPAMINTRTLNTDKERTQTIRVIPFFPCSAKLVVVSAIAGALSEYCHFGDTGVITFSMYVLGMVSAIVMVLLMHNTTQREKIPPFIMELPSYHTPQPHALFIHVWDKAKHFVKKAFTIILLSTIAIWLLEHVTWNWQYLALNDENASIDVAKSILASIGMFIQPIFTPLGFGSQLNSNGWVFSVSCISGMVAKESVTATFGTLSGIDTEAAGGAAKAVAQMVSSTGITNAGLLSFMVFNILNIPCFASVATAKGELSPKAFKGTLAFWLITSYVIASFTYLVFEWTWTLSIILPFIALCFVGSYFYNSYMTKKENTQKASV